MDFFPTSIPDVLLIKPRIFTDDRGFFLETFRTGTFEQAGIAQPFVQDNHSGSSKGVLRGLHYQIKQPQGKLVRVIAGQVFDVAVDLRRGAKTFGKWVGINLSDKNKRMLWVPPGFAHGFYVVSKTAEFIYKCTNLYAPEHERTLVWDDPEIGINWPLVNGFPPLLSKKDASGASFKETEVYT